MITSIWTENVMSKHRMFRAHEETTGGFICGEIKVAVTLRLLVGGSYLVISHIFDIFYSAMELIV